MNIPANTQYEELQARLYFFAIAMKCLKEGIRQAGPNHLCRIDESLPKESCETVFKTLRCQYIKDRQDWARRNVVE
jgi:hypothetical protein